MCIQLEAAKGKERKAAQAEVDKAVAKVARYQERLSSVKSSETLPKVEIGCLEEVISKMESDSEGEWSSVMFIPKGDMTKPFRASMSTVTSFCAHLLKSALCLMQGRYHNSSRVERAALRVGHHGAYSPHSVTMPVTC